MLLGRLCGHALSRLAACRMPLAGPALAPFPQDACRLPMAGPALAPPPRMPASLFTLHSLPAGCASWQAAQASHGQWPWLTGLLPYPSNLLPIDTSFPPE